MEQQRQLIKAHLGRLFDELVSHDGHGEIGIELRILKRGQKEVLIRCGKQYRYVVDFRPADRVAPLTVGRAGSDDPATTPAALIERPA